MFLKSAGEIYLMAMVEERDDSISVKIWIFRKTDARPYSSFHWKVSCDADIM